ncbi:Re/Si-specific NAD(P)(+) transhydrogenase subunit alpha [Nitrospirillum viridazoti]|uniref:NAD(P) transhydrogenase subunit alpha part 1 n=1 Tax=Nitrospirillum viridazoti CBAmc TaxID=1441467 RepID=A0A248JQM6_9PROT|nr:Re/Si-specific NAD(P)(+) transhydrogenase subunit alpha [Nitrospirillum amazonense]ASG21007.1 NAD(P)(+) transhydrogenase (Re/Si-specific) subunit alpha [Nitrospirillum amazonense CBAmc]TWB32499.1 NAD(P) transhydrogenase subunit alpha [Nitrospirillum amazonense]
MKIGVLKERRPGELRVAASPETVRKFVGLGFDVTIETGAGVGAAITDDAFAAAGATIAPDAASTLADADVVLKVQRPEPEELALIKRGAKLAAILSPYGDAERVKSYADAGVDAFAMEFIPRITRAQSMDVLSSQANLAGYRAVLDAAYEFGRAFPMMMTAAGTVPPARAFIMGVGVAGLQAIATARRLGAIVSATDVRPATKEQVQSLGATFVAVEDEEFQQAQTAGGYAKEMSAEYRAKQAALVAETIKKQDIVITTALIPGRKAPVLVTDAMLRTMKTGAVVVDLAVEQGGNVEGSEPGKIVEKYGVKIVGHTNVPSRIAVDSSALYAKNLLNFLTPLVDKESKALKIDWNDDIIKGTALTRDGAVVHPTFAPPPAPAPAPEPAPAAEPAAAPEKAE